MSGYLLFNKKLQEKIQRKMGIEDSPNKKLEEAIRTELNESRDLAEYKVCIKELNIIVKAKSDEVFLKDGFKIASAKLADRLKECLKVSLVAVTIGSKIEKTTRDPLRDLIRDIIGSQLVEELMIKVNDDIREKALAEGYEIVKRFSVGYGDWDIKDQAKIIKLLGVDFIKVDKKSYLMSPQKSITAIIGWKQIDNINSK